MELPSDVWRLILFISKIQDIKNLCLVDNSFYILCCKRDLWKEKFKEKNMEMINNDIKSASQYIDEYRKVSYALYTTNCLINMIKTKKYDINYNILYFSPLFIIDDFIKIFIKDYIFFNEIEKYKDIRKYLFITIGITEKISVLYNLYKTDIINEEEVVSFIENYDNINAIVMLITKILYYYPLTNITDVDHLPIIFSDNTNSQTLHRHVKNIIDSRIKYWDECYSKYEELYF